MKKITVDDFELNEEQINMLLSELKNDKVNTADDLDKYLKDHSYMKDNSSKFHLLVSKYPKKRNFAIPFDE
ncbi:hypothetical protein [Oceanobacillus sp. CAU 1775]